MEVAQAAFVSDFDAESSAVAISHAQTVVEAGFVRLTSARDTRLAGAKVAGEAIVAGVGRDLVIVSDQDTASERASQRSIGAGLSLGLGTGAIPAASVNASYGTGKAFGTYASVTATSGLFAGTGGFEVSVGGTTTLMGAALASVAEPARNSLSTAALKTGDLSNSTRWQAESSGFGLSLSTSGIGGLQPGLGQRDSGGASGSAMATIAPGRIAILNAELQKQLTGKTPGEIIAGLNRAAEAQNTAVEKLPGTLGETLQAHADRSAAFTAASAATAKLVGDVALELKSSADAAIARLTAKLKEQGFLSPEDEGSLEAARLQSELWGEGGGARALLHGATRKPAGKCKSSQAWKVGRDGGRRRGGICPYSHKPRYRRRGSVTVQPEKFDMFTKLLSR